MTKVLFFKPLANTPYVARSFVANYNFQQKAVVFQILNPLLSEKLRLSSAAKNR